MARPIWQGQISFGLVSVPVALRPAETRADISFHLVDSRDSARIRYERVNEDTGEEVPWDKIVKGFEYDKGNYVLLSDEEMEQASVEMSRTIDIEQFVDVEEIDIRYFDRPYILVPTKNSEKGYVLLREAIAASGKAGIANVVIRSRQHLAAVVAHGDALLLILLRYEQELRDLDEFNLPNQDLRKWKVSRKEIELASQLINGMTGKWNPDKYRDEYREVLMDLIKKKIKSGQTEAIDVEPEEETTEEPQTINFMDMLKKSVAKTSRPRSSSATTRKKKSTRRRKTAKKRKAG